MIAKAPTASEMIFRNPRTDGAGIIDIIGSVGVGGVVSFESSLTLDAAVRIDTRSILAIGSFHAASCFGTRRK